MIVTNCNLNLLDSNNPPASASGVEGDYRCMPSHPGNILNFFVETGSYNVHQAGLELLTSRDPPTLASQSAGITGLSPASGKKKKKEKNLKISPAQWCMLVVPATQEVEVGESPEAKSLRLQ